jgi:predicted ABC-type transport system involved in lysophospholipase L1 biosynthesis ATPase subunit
MTDGHYASYRELLEKTDWDKIGVVNGVARDPRCENCMMNCGYEPTAALDRVSGQEVVHLLRDLARSRGVPILLVTHDPRILDIADRIVEMEDGRILEDARSRA